MRNRKSLTIFLETVLVLFLASRIMAQTPVETEQSFLLLQAHGQSEVFVIIDGETHWIQNPKTAQILGYDLPRRKMLSLNDLNRYPTGETINKDPNEPTRKPRGIYLLIDLKSSPFEGLRGIITLNPKPENAQILEDLGFNAVMPYAGTVPGWKGNLISISNRDNLILRFIGDEPDCRKQDPEVHLARYERMKAETPDILANTHPPGQEVASPNVTYLAYLSQLSVISKNENSFQMRKTVT
ncbi:hypothetical protein KAV79_03720 [Candidatus Aerophobetes bacterium]|nr:hypothetical protein [Candidatus Aerophobetes bacterium]